MCSHGAWGWGAASNWVLTHKNISRRAAKATSERGNTQPSPVGGSTRVSRAGYLLVPALQHQQLPHRQRRVHAVQDVPQGFPAPRSLSFRNTLWRNKPRVVRTARPGAGAPQPLARLQSLLSHGD